MSFKVGDRVAVYSEGLGLAGRPTRTIGAINRVEGDAVRVDLGVDFLWFHPKQCRKLVKKERRRIYAIVEEKDYHSGLATLGAKALTGQFKIGEHIEFVEARRPGRKK